MLTKGTTQVTAHRQNKKQNQQSVEGQSALVPLSKGKHRNADDIEILMADRLMTEQYIDSILANPRLATTIVHRWLDTHNMVMAPKDWISEKLRSI